MTYAEIKTELLAMKGSANADVGRAQTLIGMLTRMGISPRRVRLSLRHLGLSPRQQDRRSGRTS